MPETDMTIETAPALASRNALAVLSEGHDELLRLLDECQRLAGDPSGADLGSVTSRLCGVTQAHAQIQQEVLLPALQPAADDRLQRATAARERSSQLASEVGLLQPGDAGFDAKVAALAAAVRAQITAEREALFPLARDAGIDLDSLGARLDQRKAELITPLQAD